MLPKRQKRITEIYLYYLNQKYRDIINLLTSLKEKNYNFLILSNLDFEKISQR